MTLTDRTHDWGEYGVSSGYATYDAPPSIRKLLHDIRHSLATIRLIARATATRHDVPPEVLRWSREIDDEGRWVAQLLRRLAGDKPLSRSSSEDADEWGGHSTDTSTTAQTTDIGVVVRAVVGAIGDAHGLAVSLEGSKSASVHGDEISVRRCLVNVVENAVRAAGADGRIAVRVGVAAGWSSVTVEDNGPGFGHVPMSSGLGLRIVIEHVTRMGGTVEIGRSDLGGACVTLRFRPAPAENMGNQ